MIKLKHVESGLEKLRVTMLAIAAKKQKVKSRSSASHETEGHRSRSKEQRRSRHHYDQRSHHSRSTKERRRSRSSDRRRDHHHDARSPRRRRSRKREPYGHRMKSLSFQQTVQVSNGQVCTSTQTSYTYTPYGTSRTSIDSPYRAMNPAYDLERKRLLH